MMPRHLSVAIGLVVSLQLRLGIGALKPLLQRIVETADTGKGWG